MARTLSSVVVPTVLACLLLASASTVDAWNGIASSFVYQPFDGKSAGEYFMEFSWSIRTDANNNDQFLVGKFVHNVPDHNYVSLGTSSKKDMDGLMILCVPDSFKGTSPCTDWIGSGFDIDPWPGGTLTTTISAVFNRAVDGYSEVNFERIVVRNGTDLQIAGLGSFKRTIWAWGPMEPGDNGADEPEEHPGIGIAGATIDFQSGETLLEPKWTRILWIIVIAIVTVVLAIILNIVEVTGIQVHHRVRFATAIVIPIIYIVLLALFMVAAWNDYNRVSSLGPFTRALGDGACLIFGALLLTVSRRFFFSEWFLVSHERAIKYHSALGTLLVIAITWHAANMSNMYFGSFILSWDTTSALPVVPGLIALIMFWICTVFGFTRFELSYVFFRLTHFAWIPSLVFTCLHYQPAVYYMIPGMFFLVVGWLYGRIVNCSATVTHAEFDPLTRTFVVEVTRRFWCGVSPCGCNNATRDVIGVAPAQWCYLNFNQISCWRYHPFSIARADVVIDADGRRVQKLKFAIKETLGTGGGGGLIRTGLTKLYALTRTTKYVAKFKEVQSWTTSLCRFMEQAQGPTQKSMIPMMSIPVSMEGAFGSVQLPLHKYRNIVLASGGIGVTPNLLIFQHLAVMAAAQGPENKKWDNIVFIWVNREDHMVSMFAKDILEFAAMARGAGVNVTLRLFCTKAGSASERVAICGSDEELGIIRGRRPDFDVELFDLTTAVKKGADNSRKVENCGALYSCGPVPMIQSASEACGRSADRNGFKMHVHTEVFDV